MRKTVTVLQDDIGKGSPGSPGSCAVALAVSRDLDTGLLLLQVGCWDVSAWHRPGDLAWVAALPCEVIRFISDFDQGRPVEPFKFELEVGP